MTAVLRSSIRALLAAALVAAALGGLVASAADATPPGEGPGGPVLVIANPGDPFSRYYAEILTAEGLNEFAVADLGDVTAQTLAASRVAVLAPTAVTDAQAAMLSSWVSNGGDLIGMRPDPKLAGVLGLAPGSSTLGDAYLKVSGVGPGAGITTDTMQFHGTASRWTLAGAVPVATLYQTATAPSANPAVTLNAYGSGQAAAFTYDLARSVVWTRQGNPRWAGDERDHVLDDLTRSDDLFFGADRDDPQADWVDLDKVQIPQADEQQRLLANIVTQMSADRLPLPRFWYLPRGEKAAVIMTGDDHAVGGTTARFQGFEADSPAGCSLADWECVRGTSYVYPNTPIDPVDRARFQAEGFEIGLHVSTGCQNFTFASLGTDWDEQLPQFAAAYPGLPAPRTNRTHCIAWSDWASEPKQELAHGVRLDTNYYYWPDVWVQNRPGVFTGSGLPMRFADANGALIDVYQAATQITDESGQDIPTHIATLLDNAVGPQGYFGAFTMNIHTDRSDEPAEQIVAAARRRGVPVITAQQMLDWLDGRNGSSFGGLSFAGDRLSFTVQAAAGSRGLEAMVPVTGPSGAFTSLVRGGSAVPTTTRTVKGVEYAVFDAAPGAYVATYGAPTPLDTTITAATVTGNDARFAFTATEAGATFECRLDAASFAACPSPKRYTGLAAGTHTFAVRATNGGVTDATPAQTTVTVAPGGPAPGAGAAAPSPGTASEAGPAGLATATADRSAPRVRVSPRTVRVSRSGVVRLRVACPRGERRCRVAVRLRLGRRTVAAKALTVPGARSRVVTLRLNRAGRRALARRRALTVTVLARASDAAGNRATTTTSVRLPAPARRPPATSAP